MQVGFFAALKGLIEKAVRQNQNSPAVIAAHSMGCLVTAYFLNRQSAEWQAAHIASIIVMSAPFEGAVTALKGMWPQSHNPSSLPSWSSIHHECFEQNGT